MLWYGYFFNKAWNFMRAASKKALFIIPLLFLLFDVPRHTSEKEYSSFGIHHCGPSSMSLLFHFDFGFPFPPPTTVDLSFGNKFYRWLCGCWFLGRIGWKLYLVGNLAWMMMYPKNFVANLFFTHKCFVGRKLVNYIGGEVVLKKVCWYGICSEPWVSSRLI